MDTYFVMYRWIVQAPKFQHITPILKSFHWLKLSEQIEYKGIFLSQNFQYHRATVSLWPCICSAFSWSQHTLFTLICHSYETIIITQSHSSLLSIFFTSFLESSSYIAQNSSSKLFIALSATFIWTCRFNLLHTAITCHHFSLFHSELKTYLFRKSYPQP